VQHYVHHAAALATAGSADRPASRDRRGVRAGSRPRLRGPGALEDWLAQLPGREGWLCFVAFDGDEPAGAGALFVTGTVGWLGIGATVPKHRGKGAQSAVIAKRIEAAAALGCEILVSETGKPVDGRAGPPYRLVRAGFESAYVRRNYER
jgi:GNAT superfamily N-acetyltransferase